MNAHMSHNETLSCYPNHSTDISSILNKSMIDDLNHIYKFWHGLIPLPVALLGLIFTLIYMIAVYKAIEQRRVSRKCYVLLLNRASGDVFACVMAVIISAYALIVERVNRETMQILDTFFVCCFWSAMISYVALSLIKLYAIWEPLKYRDRITMRRCIYLVVLSWIFFSIMVTYALTVIALTKILILSDWSGCVPGTCTRIMYRTRNVFVVTVYFFTIICFAITVVLIRRARLFMNSFHKKPSNSNSTEISDNPKRRSSLKERFPLYKLTINVFTFTFFNVFYVIWAIFILIQKDRCFFSKHFNHMIFVFGLVRISLLARIIADPIIAFITDKQIRKNILTLLHCNNLIQPNDSKRQMPISEENSSSTNDLKRPQRHSTKSVVFSIE